MWSWMLRSTTCRRLSVLTMFPMVVERDASSADAAGPARGGAEPGEPGASEPGPGPGDESRAGASAKVDAARLAQLTRPGSAASPALPALLALIDATDEATLRAALE